MNSTRLKYFLKLAECLSFTKAADELFISQPTLSREIGLLENELGVRLFDRRKKNITLTKEGLHMLPLVQRFVEQGEILLKTAQDLGTGSRGVLNLGYSGTADSYLLSLFLKQASAKFPDISFNLTLANHARLIMLLREGSLDMTLSISPVTDGLPDIYALPIASKTPWLCLPKDHPISKRRIATLDDLRDQTLIVSSYTDSTHMLDSLQRFCLENNVKLNIAHYNSDPQSIYYLVMSGKGLALSLGERRILEALGLCTVKLEPAPKVSLVAACMERDRERPALQSAMRIAEEIGREYAE